MGTAHSIRPGVTAWLAPHGGWGESNAALVEGHNASLLVDTLWDPPRTSAMLEGFRATLESAPIACVVNTHSDGDHWFGNSLTGGAEIIATNAAARRMKGHGPGQMKALAAVSRLFRAMSYAPIPRRLHWRIAADYFDGMMRPFDFSNIRRVLPNSTFSGSRDLEVGGRHLQLIEVGPAHTAGDLIVYLPDDRIAVAGDVLFFGVTPVLWDGSARNWIRACERMLGMRIDTVVPGHGPLTDLAGVDLMRQYWQFLRYEARKHFEKGHPAATAALAIARSDEFRKQPFAAWDSPERIMINVHGIYRRLLRRRHRVGVLERLKLLRLTALIAGEFPDRTAVAE